MGNITENIIENHHKVNLEPSSKLNILQYEQQKQDIINSQPGATKMEHKRNENNVIGGTRIADDGYCFPWFCFILNTKCDNNGCYCTQEQGCCSSYDVGCDTNCCTGCCTCCCTDCCSDCGSCCCY